MKLGIPTLCRYDLLARLLASAEAGSVKPAEYLIIDNGDGLLGCGIQLPPHTRVIRPGRNLGVAASWNLLLDIAANEPLVISNDDVEFGEHTFRDMVNGTTLSPFVDGDGWCLFAQTPECTRRVGYYDEHFWPAYYEDNDYDVRLHRAGVTRLRALTRPFFHTGWATMRSVGEPPWLRDGRRANPQYFLRKWGGGPHQTFDHLFSQPWNGAPPLGFRDRAPAGYRPLMRHDIINRIAEALDAKRYLEIGVGRGDNIGRINVPERWGVDSSPRLGAFARSTAVFAQSSLDFLATRPAPFDLAFIDGDHRAELVLEEVERVPLTDRGVIVLHDASPSRESMQDASRPEAEWTGDVWKAVAELRRVGWQVSTIDTDYGVAIVTPGGRGGRSERPRSLEWKDLRARRTELLGLVDPFAFEEWLAVSPIASR